MEEVNNTVTISKRTLFLILALVGITVILIAVAISPKKYTQGPQSSTQPSSTLKNNLPTATLSLIPVYPGPQATRSATGINIVIDPGNGNYKISAVQLDIRFDPLAVTNISFQSRNYFQNPVVLKKTINQAAGIASYTLAAAPQQAGGKSSGTVAFITFTSLLPKGETTKFYFGKDTLVTAEGVSKSVLQKTKGTNFIIQ